LSGEASQTHRCHVTSSVLATIIIKKTSQSQYPWSSKLKEQRRLQQRVTYTQWFLTEPSEYRDNAKADRGVGKLLASRPPLAAARGWELWVSMHSPILQKTAWESFCTLLKKFHCLYLKPWNTPLKSEVC
jgi:hypothetical protein